MYVINCVTLQFDGKHVYLLSQLDFDSQDGLGTSAGVMQAQYVATDVFRLKKLLVNTHGMITISVHVATEEIQE